jgi:hypothetical protein
VSEPRGPRGRRPRRFVDNEDMPGGRVGANPRVRLTDEDEARDD